MANLPSRGVQSDGSFSYQPLTEDDSIRLILIQPAPSESLNVHCILVHTTLSQCEHEILDHYTALSYVWGDTTNVRTIWVNDSPVNVTANLHSALRDLRDATRVLRLWADAICINQSDNEEKGKQVAMMGRIYATADHTVIYLGPIGSEVGFLRQKLMLDRATDSSATEPSGAEVVEFILSKPWFSRVWVFQELIFSRDPFVQCGKYRWSWNDLYRFLQEMKRMLLPVLIGNEGTGDVKPGSGPVVSERVIRGYEILAGMQAARNRHLRARREEDFDDLVTRDEPLIRRNGEEDEKSKDSVFHQKYTGVENSVTLLSLLLARRGLGVTDPRDMLFAHLGFAADGENFVADYTKTCSQVYEELARFLLESSGSYELLSFVGDCSPTRPQGLPSWVPDWSSLKTTSRLPVDGDCFSFYHVEDDSERMKVEAGFRAFHYHVPGTSVLACAGKVVDTVVKFSKPLSGLDISPNKQANISSRFASYRNRSYSNDDRDELRRSRLGLYYDAYNAWRELVNDDKIMPVIELTDLIEFSWFFNDVVELEDKWKDSQESRKNTRAGYNRLYRNTFDYLVGYFVPGFDKNLVDGRRLALLASGRHALVPSSVLMGDLVIVLHLTGKSKRGPYIARQRHDLRASTHSSVINDNFLSAIKNISLPGMFASSQDPLYLTIWDRYNSYAATRKGEPLKSEQILEITEATYLKTLKLDINSDGLVIPCMLIGDVTVSGKLSWPQALLKSRAGAKSPEDDTKKLRMIAFH